MNDSNRRRAFAEVVTAEAWHPRFHSGGDRANLHVDVVFGTGRIGAGEASGVRFRLSLKRAEVIVIVPDHEPAKVDPSTVRRDMPKDLTGKIETKSNLKRQAAVGLATKAGISSGGASAKADIKADASVGIGHENSVVATQHFKGLSVTQRRTPDGDYSWTIEPAINQGRLSGRPWDPLKCPRLQLIDLRTSGSKSMPPTIRLEVRCLREDLEISNIVLDDTSAWNLLSRRKAANTRRIAAEAAIRTLLTEEGLISGDLSDPYAPLTLAMIAADAV